MFVKSNLKVTYNESTAFIGDNGAIDVLQQNQEAIKLPTVSLNFQEGATIEVYQLFD